jgi:hypothetical protein
VKRTRTILAIYLASILPFLVSACGIPGAKDFGGRWKSVNRYDEKTVEIPLAVPYIYYIAPMDGTLKTVLMRWAEDAGMKLRYTLRSDFTITTSASGIRTSELRDAASQLSAIYAAQGIKVDVDGPDLVVDEVKAPLPTMEAK